MTLFIIAFIAGVLTVLAPCVLPLLPIIVGGTVSGGSNKARAFTVAFSLGVSVILFTLLLKSSTALINIPQQAWWWFSGGILIVFGLISVFPDLWDRLKFVNTVNRGSNMLMSKGFMRQSFWGDVLVGAALGPVFSTCSPTYFVILATVLPASFATGFLDLLAYTVGLVLMLLLIGLVGQKIVDKLGIAADPRGAFCRSIGVLFIVIGLIVATGLEQPVEYWLITHVYDITKIEQTLLQKRSEASETNPQQCRDGTCKGPDVTPSLDVGATASTTPDNVATTSTPRNSTSAAKNPDTMDQLKKAVLYKKSPELAKIDAYINTDGKPVTIGQFKGKSVVLIDFWTYSCINCQRTLPYLRAWYEKYHDQGLEIIGVHTPEFAFEHLQSNVENAVKGFGLKYPVVLDNSYGTWGAFGNQFWPRKYLIDIDGYIVFDHAGEGNYEGTEKAIQKALAERATRLGTTVTQTGIAKPQDVMLTEQGKVGSPEIYFGSLRNENLGNASPGEEGMHVLTFPDKVTPNTLYLDGKWDIQPEYAETKSAAKVRFFYKAKSVYFVAHADVPIRVKITRDGGQVLGDERGSDVDAEGYVTVKEDRLYKLIESKEYGAHILELQIPGNGLKAYTFTFG